jgi:hypothetical protein
MNTKFIMGTSALFMALLGLITIFFPQEVLSYLGAENPSDASLMVSILGSMYLGFAFLNWYSKTITIGGIYARPVAMGNFVHFAVGAVTLAKAYLAGGLQFLIPIMLIYAAFGVSFGWIIFMKSK